MEALSIPDLIRIKRDGGALSNDQVRTFIRSVTNTTIQESQIGTLITLSHSHIHTHTHHLTTASLCVCMCLRRDANGHLAEGNDPPRDRDPDQGDDVIRGSDVMAQRVGGADGGQTLHRGGGR